MKANAAEPRRRWVYPGVWSSALAFSLLAAGASADEDILRPEDAFRYTAQASAGSIIVDWQIQPGYYLYRERMKYASRTPAVALGDPVFPDGQVKEDEFFGRQEIYHDRATIRIPYTRIADDVDSLTLELKVQGCADAGICYPPQTWTTAVALGAAGASMGASTAPPASGNNLLQMLAHDPAFGDSTGDFLPPEQAFIYSAEMADPYTVRAHWDIADGYYLYKNKFTFATTSADAQLGLPALPAGTAKHDESFGDVEVYYHGADILVPISRASPDAGEMELEAGFQGCAEDGICYPPMTRKTLAMIPAVNSAGASGAMSMIAASAGSDAAPPASDQDRKASFIASGWLPWVMAVFFASGVGLAFTPCVLPMVPILSGLIVGQGTQMGTSRAFALSLTYVLAMSLTYTVAGIVTALLGQNLQATFQEPFVIIGFSALFVVFGIAMFGAFQLQMPAALQNRLTALSNRQQSGTLAGVGVMGVLSALIVGPCVAAPLAGALIVIGQTGDPVRGGLALFALSLGMGAPLIVFGTSAGKLLPRAGAWMDDIKKVFGLLMFGVALWMLSRILPATLTLLAWGVLAASAGWVLLAAAQRMPGLASSVARAIGVGAFVYTTLTLVGAAMGGSNPLQPLAGTRFGGGAGVQALDFRPIKTVADLDQAVTAAGGRYVMLDFYADWCVSCKEMEAYTFTDPGVQSMLGDTVLLRADVTANDADDRALLARFGIYGPPTIAFFGPGGEERKAYRVVGFVPAQKFESHVRGLLGAG